MTLVTVIFILILIGVGLYLLHVIAAPKMDSRIVAVIDVVVILATIVWLLNVFFPGALAMPANAGCSARTPVAAPLRR